MDEVEPSTHLRSRILDQLSIDSNQVAYYGVHGFDEVEYDQCPTEMESCFQSQFSSRRNTAPFSSPVLFLEEREKVSSSDLYTSSGEDASIIAILSDGEKFQPADPNRPVCMPWKPKVLR